MSGVTQIKLEIKQSGRRSKERNKGISPGQLDSSDKKANNGQSETSRDFTVVVNNGELDNSVTESAKNVAVNSVKSFTAGNRDRGSSVRSGTHGIKDSGSGGLKSAKGGSRNGDSVSNYNNTSEPKKELSNTFKANSMQPTKTATDTASLPKSDTKISNDDKADGIKTTLGKDTDTSTHDKDLDKVPLENNASEKVIGIKSSSIKSTDSDYKKPTEVKETAVLDSPGVTNGAKSVDKDKHVESEIKSMTNDSEKKVPVNNEVKVDKVKGNKMMVSNNEALRQRLLNAIEKRGGTNLRTAGTEGQDDAKDAVLKSVPAEKKVTNIEREKMMLNQGFKDKFEEMKDSKNGMTEQEKKMDLDDEDGEVNENTAVNDEKTDSGFEPGNMIDELQKYLLKRFGPVVTNFQDLNSGNATDNLKGGGKAVTEKENGINSEGKDIANETSDKTDSNQPQSPKKIIDNFIPHPIFFKTSIKRDPGSKLHDQLISELGSVLRKRTGTPDDKKGADDSEKVTDDRDRASINFPKRRVSSKGNKVLGNKALLASLENQLQRTLHKNKIFQRQRLKVVDFDSIEVSEKSESDTKGAAAVTGNVSLSHKTGAKLILDSEKVTKVHVDVNANTNDEGVNIEEGVTRFNDLSPIASPDSGISSEADYVINSPGKENGDTDKELYVYAFKHPTGRTEGVVCSVERRESTRDSSGRPRQYLTCINIVAESSTIQEGCPYTQEVGDGGSPSASGAGLFFAQADNTAHFTIDIGRRRGDLRVDVRGPNGPANCSIDKQSDGSHMATYIPYEPGMYEIRVMWNGEDIPGSPYNPKVVDPRKVLVIGGWRHFMDSNERVGLVVGERKQLPFNTAEAGPGSLRAEVRGPSRSIDVDVDNHVPGKSVVEFVPEEEGSHYIHLFWSDIPLTNSPFHGYAIQQVPDASKLILTGRGLKEAVVREEAEFIIDGSQAGKGSPDVVLSGVRAEVDVRVQPMGNGKFRCTYIPTVPGAYLLHITWNGRQLRGSPYKVNIIGAFYPNRVVVGGEGLRGGLLGTRMDVFIDTRKAGPGELTAYCMGPHQVAFCELQDNKDGTFNLGIKAQEAGKHVLQIKYGGEHVQGSPFVFRATARPDASKVRVHGPGVEHGILATYLSKFHVETRGAGAGQLTVRIRGPKGAFQVEMYRDSQRDRTILCRYDPTECGLYIISVKWSGVDVPGSPFHVHILDTQEELEQVLNDVSYSIGTSHSRGSSSHGPTQQQQPRMVYGQWREQI